MVAASLLGIVIFAMWKFTKEEENTSSMFVMQSIEPGESKCGTCSIGWSSDDVK